MNVCSQPKLLLVHDLNLLAHAFLVNAFEHCLDKVGRHAAKHTLRTAFVKNFRVTVRLHHRHVVFALVSTNFAADAHTLRQGFDERIVNFVDFVTHGVEALGRIGDFADNEFRKDEVKHVGRNLLGRVAPSFVRTAVALDNQTVEAQVHGLLTKRRNQFARTANVAGVAKDGQSRNAAAQFDGNMPHGQVAVQAFL